jgi:hypothetical protein
VAPREVAVREVAGYGRGQVLDLRENALVSRVNRRMPIRIVRFSRSTCDVPTSANSGVPLMHLAWAPRHFARTLLG